MSMTGTFINAGLIATGGAVGTLLSKRTPLSKNKNLMQIMGIFTLVVALQSTASANTGSRFIIMMTSTLAGGVLGGLLNLERRLHELVHWIESKMGGGQTVRQEKNFFQAFITSSILFCVGPMAILGSFDDGIRSDHSLLISKGILDGIAALSLAASLGIGIAFSAIPIILYEGSLTLIAQQIQPFMTPAVVEGITSVGGALLLFTGFNLMGITKISVLNYLPGIIVGAVVANYFW